MVPSLKIVQTTVNTCFNYWYLSLWKTMKGINSLNDRLILCQNVEINSNEYFSYDVFSGMKSSNEIWRPRGMEMPLRNNQGGSEIFQIPILCDYYGLSNDHRCNSSSIHHLLRLIMWTFFFFLKTFRHNGSAVFGKMPQMCRGCPDVNKYRGMDTAISRQHRPFMLIKSFVQHSGWQEMVSLCSLICLIGVCPDRDQPEFLCSCSDSRYLRVHVATAGGYQRLLTLYRRHEVRKSI